LAGYPSIPKRQGLVNDTVTDEVIAMSESPKPASAQETPTPDRRDPARKDRRASGRGGRRATDAFRRLADLAYRLLTEPPR
jgi:hypothetical protein